MARPVDIKKIQKVKDAIEELKALSIKENKLMLTMTNLYKITGVAKSSITQSKNPKWKTIYEDIDNFQMHFKAHRPGQSKASIEVNKMKDQIHKLTVKLALSDDDNVELLKRLHIAERELLKVRKILKDVRTSNFELYRCIDDLIMDAKVAEKVKAILSDIKSSANE